MSGRFGLVAVKVKHTSVVKARDVRALRDFVTEQKTRLGAVINNDTSPRRYEEGLVGLPFTWR